MGGLDFRIRARFNACLRRQAAQCHVDSPCENPSWRNTGPNSNQFVLELTPNTETASSCLLKGNHELMGSGCSPLATSAAVPPSADYHPPATSPAVPLSADSLPQQLLCGPLVQPALLHWHLPQRCLLQLARLNRHLPRYSSLNPLQGLRCAAEQPRIPPSGRCASRRSMTPILMSSPVAAFRVARSIPFQMSAKFFPERVSSVQCEVLKAPRLKKACGRNIPL